jgi:hypothetical protein
MKPRIGGVIFRLVGWIMTPNGKPNYTQLVTPKNTPIYTHYRNPTYSGHVNRDSGDVNNPNRDEIGGLEPGLSIGSVGLRQIYLAFLP